LVGISPKTIYKVNHSTRISFTADVTQTLQK